MRTRNLITAVVLATTLFQTSQAETESSFKTQAALFARHCAKCHTIGGGDRVGPDLKMVTRRRDGKWLTGFVQKPSDYLDSDPTAIELLKRFSGVRMTDLNLPAEDVTSLLAYVDTVSESGGIPGDDRLSQELRDLRTAYTGPDEGFGSFWPGVICALGGMLLGLLMFTQGCRHSGSGLIVIGILILYFSTSGRRFYKLVGDQQGYSPVQPIAYSHRMHAGDLKIACLYCHHGAEKSPVAGVPSINICMNCHRVVTRVGSDQRASAELQKLFDVWERKAEDHTAGIEWVRVHDLPDFVSFNHAVHVNNKIACQECHGPVQEMDQIRQASDLSMGWCVNCHRKTGIDVPTHWKRSGASQDCTVCHQ